MILTSPLCSTCVHVQWLELVLGWLSKVFDSEADADAPTSTPGAAGDQSRGCSSSSSSSILKQWRCHMQQFFCRIYVNMRIEELFSIITGEQTRKPVESGSVT